jgi:hypothetical protein
MRLEPLHLPGAWRHGKARSQYRADHMTRPAMTLRFLIAVHLVWTFLLTPLAFEPRPFSSFTPLGFVSLALIFTTVALEIGAFALVFRRPITAGTAAAIGPVLFVPAFLIDQFGLFSSQRPPTQITALEIAALATQLVIFYVALQLRRSRRG